MLLIVGISGASGAIYGIRLLQLLASMSDIETHLVISKPGEQNIRYETDWNVEDVNALANYSYGVDDFGARLASGSFRRDGMVVAPCSMRTLSALANSYTDNLLTRAADVTLKERKRLILLTRETPLHLGHLRNMERVTEMGGIIFPPVPAFYNHPQSVSEMVDHTLGKVLDLLDIEYQPYPRWSGSPKK